MERYCAYKSSCPRGKGFTSLMVNKRKEIERYYTLNPVNGLSGSQLVSLNRPLGHALYKLQAYKITQSKF